ncbi:MAG: hypothetical protein MZV70_69965 [Desulfobacterales bacterium]|nr:hypothetical protein [Desulfobacterales bacterium]
MEQSRIAKSLHTEVPRRICKGSTIFKRSENYPNVFDSFKSLDDSPHCADYIQDNFKNRIIYQNNLLEIEAVKAGKDFADKHKT